MHHISRSLVRKISTTAWNKTPMTKDEFVLIFPDKNKKNAIEIVEKISSEFSVLFPAKTEEDRLSIFAGISENPIDGVQADELYIKARDRMELARTGKKTLEAFA